MEPIRVWCVCIPNGEPMLGCCGISETSAWIMALWTHPEREHYSFSQFKDWYKSIGYTCKQFELREVGDVNKKD